VPYNPDFDPQHVRKLLAQYAGQDVRIMEVCGTHTMAIAKSGIRDMLPDGIRLISGPGCPVCVTSASALDAAFEIAKKPDVILAAYGDMLRVPGSVRGENLFACRAQGADIRTVFSAADAVVLAQENPEKQVVFLAVGFETTAAGTAAAALTAKELNLTNFSMLLMLKCVEPALKALVQSEDFACDGFLLPGHVATIIGQKGFAYVPELGIPSVIAGFEASDILAALLKLLSMQKENRIELENEYIRAVKPEGNLAAQKLISQVFIQCDDIWRGLGVVKGGGFAFRKEYAQFDAWAKFSLDRLKEDPPTACKCASVIRGQCAPEDCPMFGKACTPTDPIGPCMVSSEGACAAAYKYKKI